VPATVVPETLFPFVRGILEHAACVCNRFLDNRKAGATFEHEPNGVLDIDDFFLLRPDMVTKYRSEGRTRRAGGVVWASLSDEEVTLNPHQIHQIPTPSTPYILHPTPYTLHPQARATRNRAIFEPSNLSPSSPGLCQGRRGPQQGKAGTHAVRNGRHEKRVDCQAGVRIQGEGDQVFQRPSGHNFLRDGEEEGGDCAEVRRNMPNARRSTRRGQGTKVRHSVLGPSHKLESTDCLDVRRLHKALYERALSRG